MIVHYINVHLTTTILILLLLLIIIINKFELSVNFSSKSLEFTE